MKSVWKKLLLLLALAVCLVGALSITSFSVDTEEQVLIDLNTEWKYLDNNTDPAEGLDSLTAWTKKGFDDSAWKSASGTFGAKKGALGSINGTYSPNVLLQQYQSGTTTNAYAFFFRTKVTIDSLNQGVPQSHQRLKPRLPCLPSLRL